MDPRDGTELLCVVAVLGLNNLYWFGLHHDELRLIIVSGLLLPSKRTGEVNTVNVFLRSRPLFMYCDSIDSDLIWLDDLNTG